MTFSRIRPSQQLNSIFVPSDSFESKQSNWKKEFSMQLVNIERRTVYILTKKSLNPEGDPSANVWETSVFVDSGTWLEKNGFIDREKELEDLFRHWIEFGNMDGFWSYEDVPFMIHSRKIDYIESNQ